jgi:hypothetical protein
LESYSNEWGIMMSTLRKVDSSVLLFQSTAIRL